MVESDAESSDTDLFAEFAASVCSTVKSEKSLTKNSRIDAESVISDNTSIHTYVPSDDSSEGQSPDEDEREEPEDKFEGVEEMSDISGTCAYTEMGSSLPGSVGMKKAADRDIELQEEAEYQNVYRKYYPFEERSKEVFPIAAKREEIIEAIFNTRQSRVCIIKGETGCGKTTLVPLYILDHIAERRYVGSRKANIWVTQPRRIAATSIARHVSRIRNWKCRSEVGGLIGYQVGLDKCVSKDTRITYMTSGCALQIIRTNRNLENITHLIIDEVHERDIDIELALLLAKDVLKRNKTIKVVIMSATVETDVYRNYFRHFNPLCIDVRARHFDVSTFYVEDLANEKAESIRNFNPYIIDLRAQRILREFSSNVGLPDLDDSSIKTFIFLLEHFDRYEQKTSKEKKRGAVLAFLPGLAEINRVYNAIQHAHGLKYDSFDIYRAHSMLPRNQQEENAMLTPPAPGRRKIILSTNICESSITIPDVTFVVDFCLAKRKIRDKQTNLEQLIPIWTSEENSDQRSGRAGRTQPGFAFRLVTKAFMKKDIPLSVTPEIMTSRLENTILLGKAFYPDMHPEDFIGMTCAKERILIFEKNLSHPKEFSHSKNFKFP